MRLDPLKTGFYYVEYEYMNKINRAVYFNLESAQEALIKMVKRNVKCNGLHEWKEKPQIVSIQKKINHD
jgi:hypothetical protein